MSDGRRLIADRHRRAGGARCAARRSELTRDDQRAQGPAGSSYAYGPYGAAAYASLLRARATTSSACAIDRETSTSTRG